MSSALFTRERCVAVIRSLIGADPFMSSYALLRALENLDLGALNAVLDDVEDMAVSQQQKRQRDAELTRERFGSTGG